MTRTLKGIQISKGCTLGMTSSWGGIRADISWWTQSAPLPMTPPLTTEPTNGFLSLGPDDMEPAAPLRLQRVYGPQDYPDLFGEPTVPHLIMMERLGIDLIHYTVSVPDHYEQKWLVTFPHWMLLLILVLPLGIILFRRYRARRYRVAHPTLCPEWHFHKL